MGITKKKKEKRVKHPKPIEGGGLWYYESNKELIRTKFLQQLQEAKKKRNELIETFPEMSERIQNWGTIPMAVIIPQDHILKVSKQNVQSNSVYQTFGIADTILKIVGDASKLLFASTAYSTGAIAATVALSSVFPPLILVSLVLATTSFLVCQKQKNIELLNTSEMIFNVCQNMISDLTRMLIFYARIGISDPKIKNPFIPLTMDKLTQLQISIINLCDDEVLLFIAISYGVIETFDKKVLNAATIFGIEGMKLHCDTEQNNIKCEEIDNTVAKTSQQDTNENADKLFDTETNEKLKLIKESTDRDLRTNLHNAKEYLLNNRAVHSVKELSLLIKTLKEKLDKENDESDDHNKDLQYVTQQANYLENVLKEEQNSPKPVIEQSSIEASGRTFSKIKRAIIVRLKTSISTRTIKNLFAPGERLREVIRDTTIVGIFFSQASARFSLDALEKQQEWIETQKNVTVAVAEPVANAEAHISDVRDAIERERDILRENPKLSQDLDPNSQRGGKTRKTIISCQRFHRGKT